MEMSLLEEFKELYDKQDILSQISNEGLFEGGDIAEIHCIDAIGRTEDINGSMLAEDLNLTRGAISKMVKRLEDKAYVERYKKDGNKKEVYFRLTISGLEIFEKHKEAHERWEKRDRDFLSNIGEDEKRIVLEFLRKFNEYLEERIGEM